MRQLNIISDFIDLYPYYAIIPGRETERDSSKVMMPGINEGQCPNGIRAARNSGGSFVHSFCGHGRVSITFCP
jgi:hypothetical protein